MSSLVVGDLVRLPGGHGYGRVKYVKRNWVGVEQGKRVDEWQRFQLVRC